MPAIDSSRNKSVRKDITVGEILSEAWESFKTHFGVCVGAHIVTSIVIGFGLAPSLILGGVIFFMAFNQGGPPQEPPVGLLLGFIPTLLIFFGVAIYMSGGLIKFYLSVARGEKEVDLLDVFRGGAYFLPLLMVSLVFGFCSLIAVLAFSGGVLAGINLEWPEWYIGCMALGTLVLVCHLRSPAG
jgi:hypothetical protein